MIGSFKALIQKYYKKHNLKLKDNAWLLVDVFSKIASWIQILSNLASIFKNSSSLESSICTVNGPIAITNVDCLEIGKPAGSYSSIEVYLLLRNDQNAIFD